MILPSRSRRTGESADTGSMLDVFHIGDVDRSVPSASLASVDRSGDNCGQMTDATTNSPPPVIDDSPDETLPSLRLAGTTAGPVTEEEADLLGLRAKLVRTLATNQQEAIGIRARLERAGRQDAIRAVTGRDAFDRSSQATMDLLETVDARLNEIDSRRNASRIEIDGEVETLIRRP
jgi:hypothetical protein